MAWYLWVIVAVGALFGLWALVKEVKRLRRRSRRRRELVAQNHAWITLFERIEAGDSEAENELLRRIAQKGWSDNELGRRGRRLEERIRAERRETQRTLLERAETGDAEAVEEVLKRNSWGSKALGKRARAFQQTTLNEREYRKLAPDLKRLWRQARGDGLPAGRLKALEEFFERSPKLREANRSRLRRELGIPKDDYYLDLARELVPAYYVELLGRVAENGQAFLELRELLARTNYRRGYHKWEKGDLRKLGIELEYPAEWNSLVARWIANPVRDDFAGLEWPESGEFRLLAAAAVRTSDAVSAKIVLARCKFHRLQGGHSNDGKEANWRELREEVGVIFLTDLAKLVDRYNLDRGLTEVVETPTEVQAD